MSQRSKKRPAEVEQFKEIAAAVAPAQVDAVFSKSGEIAKLNPAVLAKINSVLRSSAANNGVCGLGCASAFERGLAE